MNIIEDTIAMCEHCYRHVPAIKFIRNNSCWLGKTCPEHGYHEEIIEIDSDFYINQKYEKRKPSSYWLDITNRCNLACPHCYQMPDNTSKDPSIKYLLSKIQEWPDDGFPISLVGAEPTSRKDLSDLVIAIQELKRLPRTIMIVTNGINLGKLQYAKKFQGINNLKWTIGLNHPEYNGGIIRKKQMHGISNCINLGLNIKNITYTLANLTQLEFVLEEMQDFYKKGVCDNARIQVGVDIGRTPDDHGLELYLSDLVKEAEKICNIKGWEFIPSYIESNRTHYAVKINGIVHRLIKWCSVKTIDLEEVQSESWANLIPGKPMSSLLHQVILRDRVINNKLPLFDTIPEKYQRQRI